MGVGGPLPGPIHNHVPVLLQDKDVVALSSGLVGGPDAIPLSIGQDRLTVLLQHGIADGESVALVVEELSGIHGPNRVEDISSFQPLRGGYKSDENSYSHSFIVWLVGVATCDTDYKYMLVDAVECMHLYIEEENNYPRFPCITDYIHPISIRVSLAFW